MDQEDSEDRYSHVQKLREHEIRILKLLPGDSESQLHCEIVVGSLEEKLTYDAVSYCWGSNDRCKQIWIHKKQFKVTQSAFDVLQHMRLARATRPVWIDIVCISQEDVEEKSRQVQMMRRIYSGASSTYVWLGTAGEGFEDALDTIEALCTEPRASQEFQVSGNWDRAREIFSRPWFRRLWTLQEAVLSKECIVMYGQSSCTLNDLFCFCEVWFQDHQLLQWVSQSLTGEDPWSRSIHAMGTLNLVERSIRSRSI